MKISYNKYNIIVTGVSKGIGKSIAETYLKLGANVIGNSSSKSYKRGKLKVIKSNFLFANELDAFLKEIKKLKRIDILINNVGINKIEKVSKIKDETIDKIINVNLISSIKITREVSKRMIKQKKGKIINISSIFGVVSKEKRSLYSSTKFALNGFTKATALDLAPHNIQVNSISPGFVKTDLTKKILGRKGINHIKGQIPLNRLAEPLEIAQVSSLITSDHFSYMTGQNIVIDGGYLSK